MFSIFRRIRFSAAASSRLRKYVLYATGEITLIVIGIVLAVQINAWKEKGREREMEQQYLVRLLEEVEANVDYFELNQLSNAEAKRTIEAFSRALADDSSKPDSLIHRFMGFMTVGAIIPKYTPVTATYDDLASTGNLSLIHEPELREAVNLLYSLYKRNASIHEGNRDWAADSDGRVLDDYLNLKWDERTQHLFSRGTDAEEANEMRLNTAPILANASIHYWVLDRVEELNAESIEGSLALIGRLQTFISDS